MNSIAHIFLLGFISISLALTPTSGNCKTPCDISGSGEVSVISNEFPSLVVIADAMKACRRDDLKISTKLTITHDKETLYAFSQNPSPYALAQVANVSISPLIEAGTLQPMNDLVKKYKEKYNIEESMLIKVGPDVMAIAFQVNGQHLFYRTDLLDKYQIPVPKTWEAVMAAAEILKQEVGSSDQAIQYPLGGTFKIGWNLAQEFTNIYLGMGGVFFKPASSRPAFHSEKGVETLKLMQKLMNYMSPDALTQDTNAVMKQFQNGEIAMANFWASRALQMDHPKHSRVTGKIDFAAAPSVTKDGPPATTIWWDGFVMAKHPACDRDLAFQVLMEGMTEAVIAKNNNTAIWLRSNYKPNRFSKGLHDSAAAGAPSYPMSQQQSLVHDALSQTLGDFFTGKLSAPATLEKAEKIYTDKAKALRLVTF